jgi:hypothetical protein
MSLIEAGKNAQFGIFIIIAFAGFYYLWRALTGHRIEMRKMEQFVAISDVVDRAVELGRPMYATAGNRAYLAGMFAPMTIAGMNAIRYITRLCIRRGARIILPSPVNPEALPLIDGIFREAASAEGHPEAYNADDVIFYGGNQSQYSMGFTGTISREGVAGAVFCGATTGGGDNSPAGYVREYGGLVIGGTARYGHQGSWAMLGDYSLFMDDVYGFGAACSEDDVVRATMASGDLVKICLIGLAVILAILAAAGMPTTDWLNI